jgi:sulfite reductase (NADPH) hemoprotein beta-component
MKATTIVRGRVANTNEGRLLDAMRAIAPVHDGEFRLTSNQNVVVANIRRENRGAIQSLVDEYGLSGYAELHRFRLNALSCVALPTCPLAMAEAERYFPNLLEKIEVLLARHGLDDTPLLFSDVRLPEFLLAILSRRDWLGGPCSRPLRFTIGGRQHPIR